ncbi:reverse transcriptase domain-containing protein [Tanacetum coccineum]
MLSSSSHLSSLSSAREEHSYSPRNEVLISDLSSLLLRGWWRRRVVVEEGGGGGGAVEEEGGGGGGVFLRIQSTSVVTDSTTPAITPLKKLPQPTCIYKCRCCQLTFPRILTDNSLHPTDKIWDVNVITGRYLSTDFVVSDSKGNMIHCSAKSNVAHNFLRMKKGGIYAVKNFVVVPNKDEFRIFFKQDMFMLEFDGETTARKVSVDPHGYLRYPFCLVDLDKIEVTNNKYLIDVAGYVTNVRRTTYTKSGSKTLDFFLANQRVTLWGGLGDVLVERKTNHVGMCAVVLTGMSMKDYNNKLYLSSSSSTVIYDHDDIPYLQELKVDSSSVQPTKAVLAVDSGLPREGTLENLLIWAHNRQNNLPSTVRPVDYPVIRYRLEVVVADDTA